MPDNHLKNDVVSSQLGLESLTKFSLKEFLSGTFAPHSWGEFESRLSVGSPNTTPALDISMGDFPKPWMFVRIMLGTLLGYSILLFLLTSYQQSALTTLPAFIFYGCFIVPFAVMTLFFEMNTVCDVSMVMLSKILMIGGAIAFLATFLLGTFFPVIYKMYDAAGAGIIEELAKLLVIIFYARNVIHTKHQFSLAGLLYGAAVGTGFAAFESAGYALNVGLQENSFAAVNESILLRGLLAPFTHIVWSAIAGGALWVAYGHSKTKTFMSAIISTRFLSLFIISVGLHFLWDSDVTEYFGLPSNLYLAPYFVWGVIAWALVFRLAATGYREIRLACLQKI